MENPTLKHRAYAHIRSKLMSGDFAPGRGLSNRALARELGISSVPVREAICQLEAEGLVEQRQRSGTYPRKLPVQEWLHLYELREVLEGNAAFHAAVRMTRKQADRMQTQCDRFQKIIDGVVAGKFRKYEGELSARLSGCDLAFHAILLEVAGNPIALKIVDQFQILALVFDATRGLSIALDADLLARLISNQQDHLKVLAALRAGDGEGARDAMVDHLTKGRRLSLMDLERVVSHAQADASQSRTGRQGKRQALKH